MKAVDGQDAPEGFVIKGNQSKKYHVPGSTWYEQTAPVYWFESVEAAKLPATSLLAAKPARNSPSKFGQTAFRGDAIVAL
ncbi:50S ribosomal protein L20 [Arthrobacter crystallopoietes BAB-32]|uniref:50S ribosomal protein L20 n=1 Tax=Arthrobacter crystallopoietes BAB-32 TaxID=1246476 RepID=N1V770_9MICC|nr:hypothetical protein [Arthrobacter crystallopoietes]EMY35957.1 50S ribosomal protein L20 [Arthrobacter crystallopoietes BAB-32]